MKFLAFLTCALMATNLWACPDFSGRYTCKQGSHVSEKEIKLDGGGYHIISDGTEFTYYPDGNTYEVEANDSMKDGKVRSFCKDNKLIVDFKATILYEGAEIARQVSVTEYLPKGQDLIITTKTKMKGLPLPVLKLNCERI